MENFSKEKALLKDLIDFAYSNKDKYLVIIVGNVVGITEQSDDFDGGTSITDEYYTLTQFNRINTCLQKIGFDTLCYFDEMDFIHDVITRRIRNNYPQKFIVLNFAQKGLVRGRKSLVPVFCEMNGIMHTNSNGFACSFAREKYYWGLCLKDIQKTPSGWLFDNLIDGWVAGEPPKGTKVIAKLCNQSSSIGLESQNSVFVYDESRIETIRKIAEQYRQPVLIQECISGKEVEVPVLFDGKTAFCLPPSGINIKNDCLLGDRILTNELRCHGGFTLFDFDEKFQSESSVIRSRTVEIVKMLDLQGVCRVDYRIDDSGNAYVIDINCNPHLTETSSVYKGFKYLGMEDYSDTLLAILGLTVKRTEISSVKI